MGTLDEGICHQSIGWPILLCVSLTVSLMAGIFKTDEEVEEFINNIGTEYKFGCLHEKDPEGRYWLQDFSNFIVNVYVFYF